MKHLANCITIIRIALAIILACLFNNRPAFLLLFIISGLSDILDGFAARKTNTVSVSGARLDSIADLLIFGVLTTGIIQWGGLRLLTIVPFIGIIVLVRIMNLVIAFLKHKAFAILHTWGNKITGLFIFIASSFFIMTNETGIFLPVCVIALLSAMEETIILLMTKKLDLNRKSIFIS